MNRGQFFKGILALVGFQGVPMPTQEYHFKQASTFPPRVGDVARTWMYDGHKWIPLSPETIEKGEEYCPLGHAQKPQIKLIQQMVEVDCVTIDGKTANLEMKCPAGAGPLEQRICVTCGMVYVKQEKPGAQR